MSDFAISGNNALQQTQAGEKLYRKVEIDGEIKYVEVPVGNPETPTNLTKAAAKEVQPFEESQEKSILTARKYLDSKDKNVRKGAEETLLGIYQQAFIDEGKTEKEAKKLAKKALKDDQAALRFEKRQTFVDKEAYKAARKADKENKGNYEYLSKSTRKFVEQMGDEFKDEEGNFSNKNFKDFMKNIANEDHQADLYELDEAAEKYDSTRKVMGKAAKQAGLDKETDKTAAKRALYVAKHAAIDGAIGAGIGAAVGYATGNVTEINDTKHIATDISDPNFDVTSDVLSKKGVKIDTRKSHARSGALAGGIAGGLSGLVSGLSTMGKIKDNGEGEHTQREDAVVTIKEKLHKEPPQPQVQPPEEQPKCRDEINTAPIIEDKPDLNYCEYKPKKGECWTDIVRAKYGITDQKELTAAMHAVKDLHGVKYTDNVQPPVLKLYYDLQVGDKVYQLDCDKDVKGTVTQYDKKQSQYNGQFNPRLTPQQTGTEYTYNRYETKKGEEEQLVDSKKFTDPVQLEDYIKNNGCK